jgi:uncharacterized protein (DUF433 family)
MKEEKLLKRVLTDPKIMLGKPVIIRYEAYG